MLAAYAAGAAVLSVPLAKAKHRLELSLAKHPSLAGHARMARRIAALVPFYEFDEHRFFRSDATHRRTSLLTARRRSSVSPRCIKSAFRKPAR